MQNSKNKIVIIGLIVSTLVIVVGILLGALVFNSPTACGTGDSNYMDLLRSRNFASGVFETSQWTNSYEVLPYRVNVFWDAPELSALASFEYLIFNCGYTDADLDDYFSDVKFYEIIFADYQNLQKMGACNADDLRLYEFHAQFDSTDYLLAQWVKPDGDKRVISFIMVFPVESANMMRAYAEKIFPELPACR